MPALSFLPRLADGADDVPAFAVKWAASVLQIIGYTFIGLIGGHIAK